MIRREWHGYFHSAVGYVFTGVFLALSGVFFALTNLIPRSGDILTFIGQMSYLWMLLCPVLTMHLMSQQTEDGTWQMLLSSPLSLFAIVCGKYLAAFLVLLLSVTVSFVFPLLVAFYGTLYPSECAVGYLGFALEGCAFLAMDVFVSSLCRSSVTAYLFSFFVNFAAWLLELWSMSLQGITADVMAFVSLYARNEPFLMGQFSFAGIAFDFSVIAFFLLLTVYRMDMKRRRGV